MNVIDSITYKRIENLEDVQEVVRLQTDIWGQDVVSPLPQLLASIHHGGILIGAFFEDKLIGFCYGLAGLKNGEQYLVSHMTGIRPEYQNVGIGFQLKVKQREWAMEYGYRKMVWTYDPLEVRNGFFNVGKLGAYARIYYPAYYGELPDKLNKGLPADRLLIEWDISSKRVDKALRGDGVQAVSDCIKLLHSEGDYPVKVEEQIRKEEKGYMIPVPTAIQELKRTNLDAAIAWRLALRKVLSEAFANGFVLSGVQKDSNSKLQFYILENKMVVDLN